MDREGAAVMMAVLESLVEDPFHSSRTMASVSGFPSSSGDDGEVKSSLFAESAMGDELLEAGSALQQAYRVTVQGKRTSSSSKLVLKIDDGHVLKNMTAMK